MADSTSSPLPAAKDTANLKGWSGYGTQIYLTRKPPVMGTVVLDELEELMRKKFEHTPGPFNFLTGNAGTGATYAANRRAFQRWKIVPRMLRNVTQRDLSISLFGRLKLPMPVIISPIGCQGIWHQDGELGTARAASKLGIPFTMSTVASRTITQVAAASGTGPRWFQLYWPQINDLTASILSRVEAAGFDVLLLTLDTMQLGWRPKDLSEAFLPMVHGYSSAVATEDPVFMRQWHNLEPMIDNAPFPYDPKVIDASFLAGEPVIKRRVELSLDWVKQVNNGVFRDWSDIAFVRQAWKKPLLLKGIQSVQDALLALDAGVDGIVVSNHGGRQLDGAIASLTALSSICGNSRIRQAQHEGKFTVLFDSGIRTGSDIVKAVALGAQAVLVGRPWVYGLALAGEAGVDAVMRSLFADLEISLALAGYRNFAEIWDKRDEVLAQDDT